MMHKNFCILIESSRKWFCVNCKWIKNTSIVLDDSMSILFDGTEAFLFYGDQCLMQQVVVKL